MSAGECRTDRRRSLLLSASGPSLHFPGQRPDQASTFFHLAGVPVEGLPCSGTACFVARRRDPQRFADATRAAHPLRCAGACHEAPALGGPSGRPPAVAASTTPVVLERLVRGSVPDLAAYVATGGYRALDRARSIGADAVIDDVEASELRGRGGAAFPAGRKWRSVRAASRGDAVVVVNADEGDPGAYIDRRLLEDDPHAVIEGLAIAATAVGAPTAYVYVRAEYPTARASIAGAIDEATTWGALDGIHVVVVDGHGSYVCGEETALIEAIEGHRPRVRPRPPYPAEHGVYGRPTLVHNVESLTTIPWIVSHGGEAYAAMGSGRSRGTKVLSLNSLFVHPGLYEVELGTSLRHVVEDLGGGLAQGTLGGVLVGGPLAGVIPPSLLDTPLTIDDLRAIGADLGHGGVVAWDEHTSILELAQHVANFAAAESCGICTPCRVGADELARLLASISEHTHPIGASERFDRLVDTLAAASLCGHGSGLAAFARSIRRHYAREVRQWLG